MTELVSRNYVANPATEILVLGDGLENGSVILVADPMDRFDIGSIDWDDDTVVCRARVTNRWCSVSNIHVVDGSVGFVATYDDGFKTTRIYSIDTEWLVKIDEGIKPKNSMFVPKFYEMDPKTEDLLPNGGYLANGMKVLIANSDERERPEKVGDVDWRIDRMEERNRWCTVGALEIDDTFINFVAVYEDGSKRMRRVAKSQPWFVKIDSVRDSVNQMTDRYMVVFDLVKDAMTEVTRQMNSDQTDRIKALRTGQKAEEATKKILGLL